MQTSSQDLDYVVAAVAVEAAQSKHTFLFEIKRLGLSVEKRVHRPKHVITVGVCLHCSPSVMRRKLRERFKRNLVLLMKRTTQLKTMLLLAGSAAMKEYLLKHTQHPI